MAVKILSIDDEPLVRESIVVFLEDSGFTVLEAGNGKEGLDVFRKERPDLILCDIHMPVMGGLDVLAEVHKESPETPFIVVSGAGIIHAAVEALRLGAWDYLVKPITDMRALEHAVNKALERANLIKDNVRYREQLEKANHDLSHSLAILKEDQEAGRSVQFQLLPTKPKKFGEYTLDHSILPSLYLSGDFIDYFSIEEGKFCFYIADVSGHGAASAFVTVFLKSLVDQFLARSRMVNSDGLMAKPAEFLEQLSIQLLQASLGKYLTMFYGVVDEKDQTLTYAIGGHFPPPIFITGTEAKYLPGTGFPIGIFKKAKYETHTVTLPKEFNLVMFSDGILEILQPEALEEKEKLLLSLVAELDLSVEKIVKKLDVEQKTDLPDDITFLMLKRGQ
jgi:phosphoserine phosphatase RsbU/P